MTKQVIGIGTSANDGTGDPVRDAFDKANDNFTENYDAIAANAALIALNPTLAGNNTFTGNNKFNGFFGYGSAESLTIASNAVTVTKSFALLSGEGAAADQLDTINSSAAAGDILILSAGADDITVSEVDNIILGATTRLLSSTADRLMLIFTGTNWIELSFADNA